MKLSVSLFLHALICEMTQALASHLVIDIESMALSLTLTLISGIVSDLSSLPFLGTT